jgi:hypothetical protein
VNPIVPGGFCIPARNVRKHPVVFWGPFDPIEIYAEHSGAQASSIVRLTAVVSYPAAHRGSVFSTSHFVRVEALNALTLLAFSEQPSLDAYLSPALLASSRRPTPKTSGIYSSIEKYRVKT